METVNIKAIQLDLKKPKLTTIGDFIQNDTNIIKFTLTENGSVIDLDVIDQILVNYKKPSGEIVSRIATAEADVITYQLGLAEMSEPGLGKLVIQFFKSDNRISTFTVDVNIKKSIESNFAFEEAEKGLVDQVIQELNLVNTRIDNIAFDGVDTSKIATKEDLRTLATKAELSGLATKTELSRLTTKEEENRGQISSLVTQIQFLQSEIESLKTGNPIPPDTTAPILTITPATTFTNTQTVTMTTNETADIYYTLDSTTPTNTSVKYTSPITLTNTTTVKAFARDTTGNNSAVQTVIFTKTAVPDTTPPANVTNLNTSNVSTSSVNLLWTASTSGDVAAYEIYNGSALLTSITGTSYTVTGLTPNTTYTFTVKAKDAIGNVASGTSVTVKTTNNSVTGVTLNRNTANLQVNDSITLVADVQPTNALNKDVVWTSSEESIATVNNGLVTVVGVGSAVITVTTVEGNHTATCIIYATAQITGFDFNNLMTDTDSVTPIAFDRTVPFGGVEYSDFVHPSVLYFENGWNGHKYWMGITPYAATQGATENPFFFYSDDGDNWFTPEGLTQPIYGKESDIGNNSDSHLFMDYDGITMHYLNRGAFSGTGAGSMIEIFSTTNGVNFTPRKRIITMASNGVDYVSPSVCKLNGKYYMFATDVTDLFKIAILEAEDVYGTWTEIHRISTGDMGSLWHTEVQYYNQEFIVVGNNGGTNGGNLMLGKFYNLTDAVVETRANAFALPPIVRTTVNVNGIDKIWNDAIYKCSLVMKSQDDIELFIGYKGVGVAGNNTPWRVSRVSCTKNEQTLDLSNYIEVASYTNNVDGSNYFRIADYNRHVLDFTLAMESGFEIHSFGRTTNQSLKFMIENKVLKVVLWGYNGNSNITKNVTYGVKLGDRITFEKDEGILKIYVNARKVYERTFDGEPFTWFGGRFGDYKNVISMTDIKLYVSEENLQSTTKAEERKNQLASDYQQNPSNFVLVDEFNRATLGATSDNGINYTIVGSPVIVNNMLNATNSKVLVPYEGDFSFFVKISPTFAFSIIYDYVDDNNYKFISPTHQAISGYYMGNVVGGVKTDNQKEVAIKKTHTGFTYFRVDVVGDKVTLYGDEGYIFEYSVTRQTSSTMIGLTNFGGTTRYDYVYIKKINV